MIVESMQWVRAAGHAYRYRMLRSRVRQLARGYEPAPPSAAALSESLVTRWANPWSVDSVFLASMLRCLQETSGPVLECGSGDPSSVSPAIRQVSFDRPTAEDASRGRPRDPTSRGGSSAPIPHDLPVKSGQLRSLCEISVGSPRGHTIPKAGSSHLTPSADSGA